MIQHSIAVGTPRKEHMQVQGEQSHDEIIEALQRQVAELTAANLLLKEQLAVREQFAAMIASCSFRRDRKSTRLNSSH